MSKAYFEATSKLNPISEDKCSCWYIMTHSGLFHSRSYPTVEFFLLTLSAIKFWSRFSFDEKFAKLPVQTSPKQKTIWKHTDVFEISLTVWMITIADLQRLWINLTWQNFISMVLLHNVFDHVAKFNMSFCNVRRIVACLCLPVALAWRLFLIVLITVTRPRVIEGPRFFG